jgi:hypothetical protein
MAWRKDLVPAAPGLFPPEVVMQVKALACELPANRGLPLSRMSTADVAREIRNSGIVASISDKTVWRWLHEDAIRPWQHRCWIFPRDPDFKNKAGRLLGIRNRSGGSAEERTRSHRDPRHGANTLRAQQSGSRGSRGAGIGERMVEPSGVPGTGSLPTLAGDGGGVRS